MPDTQSQIPNAQTLVIDADQFAFETIESHNGIATVLKFKVENPSVQPGDALLILAGDEIHFHGLIGRIEEGWATAADRSGSMLPA